MSGTQLVTIGLVLLSFAAGWWSRGARDTAEEAEPPPVPEALRAEVTEELGRGRRAALGLLAALPLAPAGASPPARLAARALRLRLNSLGSVAGRMSLAAGSEHPAVREVRRAEATMRELLDTRDTTPEALAGLRSEIARTTEAAAAAIAPS